MVRIFIALTYAVFIQLVISSPLNSYSSYVVKEVHNPPAGWKRIGSAPKNHSVTLQIGLKQGRFEELERHLYKVSNPEHHRYGQHLTANQVHELIKPSKEALSLVDKWLDEHGIIAQRRKYTPAQDWISFSLELGKAESLLNTTYSIYQHQDGTRLIRSPKWSIPIDLHEHIISIQPTNSFMRAFSQRVHHKPVDASNGTFSKSSIINPESSNLTVAEACNINGVTPSCLRALYRTNDYKPQAPGRNKVGITNYLGNTSNRSDVNLYIENYAPWAKGAQFPIVSVAGGQDDQTLITDQEQYEGQDMEGNLDAEVVIGLSHPTPLTVWNTGTEPPFIPDIEITTNSNEPFMTWLNYILSQKSIPQTISTSYGDHEQTVPLSYARAVCNQFAQLGARGVTMLFSSGDSGVGGTPYNAQWCVSNDGKSTPQFIANFPASCPYVTTVGATKEFQPEVLAWDRSISYAPGAGYSVYFPRPRYQDKVVPAYTKSLGSEFKGMYNPAGRAYPDLSAQGQRVATIWKGAPLMLDGTSASAPIVAGIISLVNDALISEGRPPLGFLNPWLYKEGWKAFNDITSGSAKGCNSSGFSAKEGWDVASGWGTPDFPKLKAAAFEASDAPWLRRKRGWKLF